MSASYKSRKPTPLTVRFFAAAAVLLLLSLSTYAQNGSSIDVNQKLEFVEENGQISMRQIDSEGVFVSKKKVVP